MASVSELIGTIATAQTINEEFPILVSGEWSDSKWEVNTSFDLVAELWKIITKESLADKLAEKMSWKLSDTTNTWIMGIETAIKTTLEANITSLLTCDITPIIPNKLIGAREFLNGEQMASWVDSTTPDISLGDNSEGIIIPVSALDFTGVLSHCPTDLDGKSFYIESLDADGQPLTTKNLWKSSDFNAFLWYVKNKGIYGNLVERRKLIWDNRYVRQTVDNWKSKKTVYDEGFFTKEEGKYNTPAGTATGVIPFDLSYLTNYNLDPSNKRKKQILECIYIEGDGIKSDSFQFKIAGNEYYQTRSIEKKKNTPDIGTNSQPAVLKVNKTIFEFNHDFIQSLHLFDAKTYITQLLQYLSSGALTFNASFGASWNEVPVSESVISAIIDNIIKKTIENEDMEVDDCAFTFSNAEYETMIQNAINNRNYTDEQIVQYEKWITAVNNLELGNIDKTEETANKIRELIGNASSRQSNWNWDVTSNNTWIFELVRAFAYPLIRPLFSPKVITLILINMKIMGNPLEDISLNSLMPYYVNIMQGLIKQVKDLILEMMEEILMEYLVPILVQFNLKLMLERLHIYINLLKTISGCLFNISKNNRNTGIDDVEYVDIYPSTGGELTIKTC